MAQTPIYVRPPPRKSYIQRLLLLRAPTPRSNSTARPQRERLRGHLPTNYCCSRAATCWSRCADRTASCASTFRLCVRSSVRRRAGGQSAARAAGASRPWRLAHPRPPAGESRRALRATGRARAPFTTLAALAAGRCPKVAKRAL